MLVLDPEYQTLIKMRYILRNEEVSDVCDLEKKARKLELDSNMLQEIADDMANFKQKGDISRTSVGRWFGRYAIASHISKSNLNVIAKYLLCDDWDEVTNLNVEDIEDRIYRDHRLAIAEQLVSMDSRVDNSSFGLQRLISHNIDKGKLVEIRYGKRNKMLKLKKLDASDRYLVLHCDSKVLTEGLSISIPAVLLGVNIIGLDIKDKGVTIKSIYKSSGTVTNIKILDSAWGI